MSEQWKDDLAAVGDTIESLRDELAAARAQVEKEALEMGGVIHDLRRELARTIDSFLVTQARAQRAEARAESNARDAARYRWLRSKAKLEYMHPRAMEDSRMEWTFPKLFGMTCVLTEIPVDEAIDAAIAGEKK